MTGSPSSAAPHRPEAADIRLLDRPAEMAAAIEVLGRIWPSPVPIATVELLRSMAHVGGYVAGAFIDEDLVGASFGFLARHDGRPALHSHVTGIIDEVRHHGLGRRLKTHQRRWAADQGLELISWTFDPLVRRNAWFNIAVLGARATEYHIDFYGPMGDSLNAGDDSDRLLVIWPTNDDRPDVEPDDRPDDGPDDRLAVATPEDIVELRHRDPAAARSWRIELRQRLTEALGDGRAITGFTADGDYLISRHTDRRSR